MTDQTTSTTSDERLLAAVAHFFGMFIAFIIWLIEKDKSRYVRFQALQAILFDLIVNVTIGIVFACSFGLMFLLIFGGVAGILATTPANGEPGPAFFPVMMLSTTLPFLPLVCLLPLLLGLFVARLIAAIKCYQGEDFKYPWLGRRLGQQSGGTT